MISTVSYPLRKGYASSIMKNCLGVKSADRCRAKRSDGITFASCGLQWVTRISWWERYSECLRAFTESLLRFKMKLLETNLFVQTPKNCQAVKQQGIGGLRQIPIFPCTSIQVAQYLHFHAFCENGVRLKLLLGFQAMMQNNECYNLTTHQLQGQLKSIRYLTFLTALVSHSQ